LETRLTGRRYLLLIIKKLDLLRRSHYLNSMSSGSVSFRTSFPIGRFGSSLLLHLAFFAIIESLSLIAVKLLEVQELLREVLETVERDQVCHVGLALRAKARGEAALSYS